MGGLMKCIGVDPMHVHSGSRLGKVFWGYYIISVGSGWPEWHSRVGLPGGWAAKMTKEIKHIMDNENENEQEMTIQELEEQDKRTQAAVTEYARNMPETVLPPEVEAEFKWKEARMKKKYKRTRSSQTAQNQTIVQKITKLKGQKKTQTLTTQHGQIFLL